MPPALGINRELNAGKPGDGAMTLLGAKGATTKRPASRKPSRCPAGVKGNPVNCAETEMKKGRE